MENQHLELIYDTCNSVHHYVNEADHKHLINQRNCSMKSHDMDANETEETREKFFEYLKLPEMIMVHNE
jgi:hypothetical protein